ncbi:UPF0481 protein At3g47200-like [Typha latifolia]|uniref:UPF0481 protein At3g47200-like n=1 Tax=Typha latifolia TaxID=4733 RepID=UPI003C2DE011
MAEIQEAVVIDVEADLVAETREKLAALPMREHFTFSRVPKCIRERNKNLYEPMVISIGPYHHGREHLQAMEKQKLRYLRDLLNDTATEANLEDLFEKMRTLEDKARKCYTELITLTPNEFVKMMVLDACFIIALSLKLQLRDSTCFDMGWGLNIILDQLFKVLKISGDVIDILSTNLKSQSHIPGMKMHDDKRKPSPVEIHHFLHLYYYWFVPEADSSPSQPNGENPDKSTNVIPCATALQAAGVKFRRKIEPRHMFDITFKNGVMEIPFLPMHDSTKPIFTSLIAFEQHSKLNGLRYMTSFSLLLDLLIDSEKDTEILQQSKIIRNILGSGEEVAVFFNQLGHYAAVDLKGHYFAELFRQVNRYCDTKWHSYRATLMCDYFRNPWMTLSLLAALLLLLLTFLQTFFALYGYFRPR